MQTGPVDIVQLPPVATPAARHRAAIAAALAERATTLGAALDRLGARAGGLAAVAGVLIDALRGGRKVLVVGNGGSATPTPCLR